MSKTTNKFAPGVRERAVRMVLDHERDHPSRWAAVVSIAEKIGCGKQCNIQRTRSERPDQCAPGASKKGTTVDEFERMMSMEGVRPLDQPKGRTRRLAKQSGPVSSQDVVTPLEPGPGGHAWVTGPRARTALETALERLATEIHNGRRGWATGIRQDGTTITLPASSGAASLLGAADRQSLRLMIVGGDGWTFVMHPLMGVATLDEDPARSE